MAAKEKTTVPAPLHPVVRATGFVSFFTDMGSEIVYPILPSFLSGIGASKTAIGAIEPRKSSSPALRAAELFLLFGR
jgi:hypothetical protein